MTVEDDSEPRRSATNEPGTACDQPNAPPACAPAAGPTTIDEGERIAGAEPAARDDDCVASHSDCDCCAVASASTGAGAAPLSSGGRRRGGLPAQNAACADEAEAAESANASGAAGEDVKLSAPAPLEAEAAAAGATDAASTMRSATGVGGMRGAAAAVGDKRATSGCGENRAPRALLGDAGGDEPVAMYSAARFDGDLASFDSCH